MNADITVTTANADPGQFLLVDGSIIGPTHSLTKAGPGVLLLNGSSNNYSNTTVNAGTLWLTSATLNTNATVSISGTGILNIQFAGGNNVVGALVTNGVYAGVGYYNSGNCPLITDDGSTLQVLSPPVIGPTGPGYLTNSLSGSTLSFSWPAGQGWRLQAQTNSLSVGLSSNWHYVTDGTVNTFSTAVNPTNPAVLYRLTYP